MKLFLQTTPRKGMTLIELMIVVSVLGILAAIVIPTISNAGQKAAATSAATSMREYAQGCTRYKFDNDAWPPTVPGGQGIPADLAPYVAKTGRLNATPADGYWDYNNWGLGTRGLASGERFSVGVLIARAEESYYPVVDEIIDDGDVAAGTVQQYDAYGYTNLVWKLE